MQLTVDNYIPLGMRGILLKLEPLSLAKTAGGLIIPEYQNGVSDGGRPVSPLSNREYSNIGKIVAISERSAKTLVEEFMPLEIGDFVLVTDQGREQAFFLNKQNSYSDHEGYVLVTPTQIQAKLVTYESEQK